MPTEVATPCPSGPVVVSTPEVQRYSGWPGVLLSSWRNFLTSSRVTDGAPSTSYPLLTDLTPVRCRSEYSSIDAWPIDRTNRSRFGQIGSCGSNRRNSCQSVYATGAMAIGVPGCPELAAWTASIDRVRMVLMLRRSSAAMRGTPEKINRQVAKVAKTEERIQDRVRMTRRRPSLRTGTLK